MRSKPYYDAIKDTEVRKRIDSIALAQNTAIYEQRPLVPLGEILSQFEHHERVAVLELILPDRIVEKYRTLKRRVSWPEFILDCTEFRFEVSTVFRSIPLEFGLTHPETIDSYSVSTEIGAGVQGVVVLGFRPDDPRSQVAIKYTASQSEDDHRRIESEGKYLARLRHKNVLSHIGHGTDKQQGISYLITEVHPGNNLRSARVLGLVNRSTAISAMTQVCDAVTFIHRKSNVHSDIKPSNIFLRDDGTAILMDFGTAVDLWNFILPLTTRDDFSGTPAFQSPETVRGDSNVDPQLSDVFSIGGTLGWLLTGVPPGPDEEANTKFRSRLDGITKDLRGIICKATALDPSLRFGSTEELAFALRDCGTKLGQKAKMLQGALILVAGILIAMLGLLAFFVFTNPNRHDFETARESRKTIELAQRTQDKITAIAGQLHETVGALPKNPTPWFQTLASEKGLDLKDFDKDDFHVQWHITDMERGEARKVYLYVTGPPELTEFLTGLQYRIGLTQWKNVWAVSADHRFPGPPIETHRSVWQLIDQKDVVTGGTLQLRIADPKTSQFVGPYHFTDNIKSIYDAHVIKDLGAAKDGFRNARWIEFNQSEGFWSIGECFGNYHHTTLVRKIRIGATPHNATVILSLENYAMLTDPATDFYSTSMGGHTRLTLDLQEAVSEKLAFSTDLFVSLVFDDGSISEEQKVSGNRLLDLGKMSDAAADAIVRYRQGRDVWELSGFFFKEWKFHVREIRFGTSASRLDNTISFRPSGDVENSHDFNSSRRFAFERVEDNWNGTPSEIRYAPDLYWKVVFNNGDETPILKGELRSGANPYRLSTRESYPEFAAAIADHVEVEPVLSKTFEVPLAKARLDPSGRYIYVALDDGELSCIDVSSGDIRFQSKTAGAEFRSLRISPSGDRLLSCFRQRSDSRNEEVSWRLLNAKSGDVVNELPQLAGRAIACLCSLKC